jgi:hypothetical protein
MLAKILISFCVFVYGVVIPFLEINPSHVFNLEWPAHARFHEVWQLITNISLGLLCLWLVWLERNIRMAGIITIIVMGGIVVAHLLEGFYGGSILSGNLSQTIMGLELAVFAGVVVIMMAVIAMILESE